ncbi:hypothetical protein A6B43_06050 [Vespertiliibacter pulmonis]|uniref:Pilus assembly protein HofN n=1 Tax=Vespertiliibacter pulmonis TaxID=1443036 RepID=A0A3N4VL00_9PAST|nr:hypothetical protein [Vespertiliibacter pulmonis]QLB21112.1 hypothetical protein A6B43_06050 [Vespertiliibacter pulmonis]RPE83786.1 hypothetical protein EDC46_0989 [Vespertiliibacter pulmonis]
MNNLIRYSYIKPYSNIYQFLTHLNRYLIIYIIITIIVILSYPVLNYLFYKSKLTQQHQEKENLQIKLSTSIKLKESLNKHTKLENLQDKYISIINQKIKNILNKQQAKIENLQWSLDNEHKLYLTFNQQSNHIFHILSELNTLEKLYPKEILISKLDQDRMVQINAIFVLKN